MSALTDRIAREHHLAQMGGGSGGEKFYCACRTVTSGTEDDGFMVPHLMHVAEVTEKAVREQVVQEIRNDQDRDGCGERDYCHGWHHANSSAARVAREGADQ